MPQVSSTNMRTAISIKEDSNSLTLQQKTTDTKQQSGSVSVEHTTISTTAKLSSGTLEQKTADVTEQPESKTVEQTSTGIAVIVTSFPLVMQILIFSSME